MIGKLDALNVGNLMKINEVISWRLKEKILVLDTISIQIGF